MIKALKAFALDIGQRISQLQPAQGSFSAYLIAFALLGMALLTRLSLAPIDAGYQYVTFFPAVALAAIIGGFWPGVFVAIGGAVFAEFFFTLPYYAFSIASLKTSFWSIMVFLLDGLIVSSSIEAMHRYRAKSAKEFQEVQAQNSQIRQLQQETERLLQHNQLLMLNSMDGIHVMDMQGNIIAANDAFCRMLGYTQEEVTRLNIRDWDVLHSEDEVRENFNSLINKSMLVEAIHRRKNGELINVEINASGVLMGNQRLVYCSSRDITERKKIEFELREREALLNAVMKGLPVGVWITDKEGKIIFGNDYGQKILAGSYCLKHDVKTERFGEKNDLCTNCWECETSIALLEKGALQAIGKRDISVEEEIEIVCLDGKHKNILNLAHSYCGNDGDVIGAVIVNQDISERKQSEERLRKSEEQLQFISDHTPVGIAHCDREQCYRFVNPLYAEMFGLHPADFMGKHLRDVLGDKIYTQANPYIEAVLTGQPVQYDITLRLTPDKSREIHVSYAPEYDTSGQVVGFVAALVDITELKRAEMVLNQHKRMIDTAAEGFWVTDARGNLLEANMAYAKMSGYSIEELVNMHISQLEAIETSPEQVQARIAKIIAQGYDQFETRHRHKNGYEIAVEISTTYMADMDRFIAFCHDITERKKAELEKLQDSDLRFRGTLEQVAVGIIHASLDGCFRQTNQKFCEIIGYSREELLHMSFREITFFADHAGEEERLLQLLAGKISNFSREQRYVRKDQSLVWVNLTISLLHKTDEAPAYYIGVVEDIADRKHAEVLAQQYGHLLQGSFDEIYLFDAHTLHFLLTSEGAERNLGYSSEELNQLTPLDLKPFFDRESFEKWIAPLRSGEQQSITFETDHLRKDGTTYLVEVRLQLMNADHPVFMAIVQDITERKQADIEINQSRKLLRELVVQSERLREEERKHIARELHDELGQILTALRMNTSLLRIEFGVHDAALLKKINRITELLDQSIQCTRNVVAHLRPAALDMGIVPAVRWLRDEFVKHSGVSCVLFIPEEETHLDEALAVSAFRVIQESLTNVARYAEASQVEIFIKQDADNFSVTVNDNGKGFDYMAISNHKSFGLLGMRERAIALGGVFNIYSAPRQGTQIFFVVPNKKTSTAMKGDKP